MRRFTRKGFGRIYVEKANEIETVKKIIKEIDDFEFEYLPENLIATMKEYPLLEYTAKFDSLDLDALTAICLSKKINILCVDNQHEEFMENAIKTFNEKDKLTTNEFCDENSLSLQKTTSDEISFEDFKESNLISKYSESRQRPLWLFWLSKDSAIPDKEPVSRIRKIVDSYYVNKSNFGHETYNAAYKAMVQGLKRKGKIK